MPKSADHATGSGPRSRFRAASPCSATANILRRASATAFRVMPANALFALGVGHVRRRGMEPGSRTETPGRVLDTHIVELSTDEWRVLEPLKREFTPDEI